MNLLISAFSDNHEIWATKYAGSYSDQENEFRQQKLTDSSAFHLPLLVNIKNEKWLAITEANLTDWAGMHLEVDSLRSNTLDVKLASRKDNPEISVKSKTPAVLSMAFNYDWR